MKQAAIAAAILVGVSCGVVALLLGWRHVPGLLGEWLGMLAGIVSTPVFLEVSVGVAGVLIVIGLNTLRRRREGDEFVSPEELETRDAPQERTNPAPPTATCK
ncbi:MAG: hypothetical protein WCP45_07370 [Verrucomicrobiota bacterium]